MSSNVFSPTLLDAPSSQGLAGTSPQQQANEQNPFVPQTPFDGSLFGAKTSTADAQQPYIPPLSVGLPPLHPFANAASGANLYSPSDAFFFKSPAAIDPSVLVGDWMAGLTGDTPELSGSLPQSHPFQHQQQQQTQHQQPQYHGSFGNTQDSVQTPRDMSQFLQRQVSFASSVSSFQPSPSINVISPEETVTTPYNPYMSAHTPALNIESPYFPSSFSAANTPDPVFSMEALLNGLVSPNGATIADTPVADFHSEYFPASSTAETSGMSILDEVESELKTVHGAGATGDPEQDPAMQKIMRALATVRARRGSSKQSNMAQDLFLQQQQQQQQQQTQSTLPNQAQSPSSQWQPEQQFLQGLPPAEASDATHLLGETPSADPGAGDSFNTLFAPLSFEALKPSQAAARPPLDQNVSGNPYPTPSTDTTPFAAPFFSSPAHPLASPFHATFNGEMTPGAPQSLLSPYAHTVAASELFLSPYSDLGASPYSPYDASDYGGSDVSYQEDGLQDLMNILNSPLPPFTDETGLQSSSSSSVGPSGGVGTTSGGTGTTRKPSASPATGPRPPRPSISKRPRVKRTNTTTPKTAPTDPEAPNTSSSSSMQLPKLYPCTFPDCTKTFTRSYNLKSHSLLHTGIKPFACAGCPATFLRKHDRDRHFNSLHGGASGRRFKCELCGAGFARADALRRHVEVEERTGAPGGHGHGGDGEKEGSAGYSQDDRHTVDDAGKDGGAALSFMDQLQGGGHAPADESLESLVLGPTASGPTGAGTSMNALGYRLESGL